MRLDECVKSYNRCYSQPYFDERIIEDFKRLSMKDHSAKVHLQECGYLLHKFRIGLWIDELMPNIKREEKMDCLAKSTYLSSSLLYVRLMSCETFLDQMKFAMGVSEDPDIPAIKILTDAARNIPWRRATQAKTRFTLQI